MRLFTGEALLVARASAAGVNERDQRMKPPVMLKLLICVVLENLEIRLTSVGNSAIIEHGGGI